MYADKYLFKHVKHQEIAYVPKITPILKYHACWTREKFQESSVCALTILKYLISELIPYPSLLCY